MTYLHYEQRGNTIAIEYTGKGNAGYSGGRLFAVTHMYWDDQMFTEDGGTTYIEYNDADLATSIVYPSGVANYFYYEDKLRRYAMEDSQGLHYFVWDDNGMNLLAEKEAYGGVTAECPHGHADIEGIGSSV